MNQNTNTQIQLNIINDINVKNANICLEMGIKIKGLIFLLDSYIISLEADIYSSNNIYLKDGISTFNILLDLLLKDNTKLENNQEHIHTILKYLN